MTKNRAKKKKIGYVPLTPYDLIAAHCVIIRGLQEYRSKMISQKPLLIVSENDNACTCSPQDLQPLGECICTPIPVPKEPKIVCCLGCSYPHCYCQK